MDITEKQFESQVKDLAKLFGWLHYHTWRSIHSPAGFPDVVMVRPPRLIFAELKSEKGKVSPKQQEWLDALGACQLALTKQKPPSQVSPEFPPEAILGMNVIEAYIINPEVYLWRPSQIEEIAEVLR